MEVFGSILKGLRTRANLTQEELAKALNIHKGTLSNWELNNRTPGYDMLYKIAEYFNVKTDLLLGKMEFDEFVDIRISDSETAEEMKNQFYRANNEEKKIIAEEIKGKYLIQIIYEDMEMTAAKNSVPDELKYFDKDYALLVKNLADKGYGPEEIKEKIKKALKVIEAIEE